MTTLPGLIGEVRSAAAAVDEARVQVVHDCILAAMVRAGHSQKTAAGLLGISDAQMSRDLLTLARLVVRFSRLGLGFSRVAISGVLDAVDENFRRTA
jgi:hypothetical protein